MNVYSLFPIIATIAYIPLLATTIGSRPWHKRHLLFILFLIPAMMWSFTDIFLRGNFFPQHNLLLFRILLIIYATMVIQFHYFLSSFYVPNQKRWLYFAYASLVIIIVLVALGYVATDIAPDGDRLYPRYGIGIIALFIPLMTLAIRNLYIFGKRLKSLDNPALHNQIVSLIIGICVLIAFTLTALLPWGREFPISHFGNLINAFILSYATIRHQLVDIRTVLRRGLAWAGLVIIGASSYWILLFFLHTALEFQISLTAMAASTAVAIGIASFIYRLRSSFFTLVSRSLQGQSYDYRQELSHFADTIHNVFSLKAQGGELLTLITKAIGCQRVCLLFPEAKSNDFTFQLAEPKGRDNPLASLIIKENNPIVEYLNHEQKPLTREDLSILPEFRSLWEREKEAIDEYGVELFLPLISRGKLIAILVLGKKQSGRYSLEDYNLLEDVTQRVAVSMEKEYLQERLREHEEELSLLNRSSSIISSSLDIHETYDRFIDELKKLMDINWATIFLVEENNLYILALWSEIDSPWQTSERIPRRGTATEWVVANREPLVISDLSHDDTFITGKYLYKQGMRSFICLPLIVEDEAIGTLVLASRQPGIFNQRYVTLLEQLTSQIAMSVTNARLYAKAEEEARVDQITGLLNRRSLDEMIISEIGRHSRYGGIFSLIILDLDSFKIFNDNYGHLAGDRILKQVGNTLKNSIRNSDQAFRYGGDEFAIVLPQTGIDAAKQVAERARKQVAERVKSKDIPLTISLGLATWPTEGISIEEIIAAADAALYYAKRSGGNRCHCASGRLLPSSVIPPDVEISTDSNEALRSVHALAAMIDGRDHYTGYHSQKVIEFSLALAVALNLEPSDKTRLENCALLLDIGKIGISDEILNKGTELTNEEWEIVKTHPQLGASIVGQSRQLAPCVAGILYHHERYDGSGYPKGLKGDEIPLDARILAIADAFAALTTDQPYAKALSTERALEEIKLGAGKQFDPRLVELFCSIIKTAAPLP